MPSVVSSILKAEIHAAKPFLRKMDIEAQRRGQDAAGLLGATAMSGAVDFSTLDIGPFDAAWCAPKDFQKGVILYLHGGAYVAGGIEYSKGFGSLLAYRTKRLTLCIGYSLAPEHPYPKAVDDALTAYRYLLAAGFEEILIIGESAGGGLTFALAQRIRDEGLPQPKGLVGISPWTDLTCSGASYQYNRRRDPTLSKSNLQMSARLYAGDKLKHPYVSPVYGDLTGLPPSLVLAGTSELLTSDAAMLYDRLRDSGNDCRMFLEEGMWHVYVIFPIPEAKLAIERICAFVDEMTGQAPRLQEGEQA